MDASSALIAAPQNVAEVEQLIQRLYQPGPPSVIQQINDQLQKLQLSADGWKLADELLGSADANVRFFGALTFTVKLNNDGPSLDDEAAQTVRSRLTYWLVRLIDQGEGALVCKKLCSTLTTYFVQTPLTWDRAIFHVALCLTRGDVVPAEEASAGAANVHGLLQSLRPQQLIALLWFAGSLAEDVGKIDTNAQMHARLQTQMEVEVKDAGAMIDWSLQQVGSSARGEALQTFLAWINYAQPVWPRNPEALQHLRDLIAPAAACLSTKELATDALDIFRDVLESYTSFFKPQHMAMLGQIINTEIGPLLEQSLFQQDNEDHVILYGQFVIAFGCANIQQIVEEQTNSRFDSKSIIELHLGILTTEGYPGDEDQLSIQSIEFWNTYIEYANDALFSKSSSEPDPVWLPQVKFRLQQVFQLLWKKMITPPAHIAQEWSDDEREGFKEFRLDTVDLLLSVFVLLGRDMLQQLVQLLLQSLDAKHWHAVEACLFILNTLADNILEDPVHEAELERIFRSSLFREIADFSQALPPQTRRTAIDLLGSYGQYIERHAEFLPDTLRYLFASLETAGLANAAAKSIASLCATCRGSLTGELPGFLAQYQRFLESGTSEPYTKEKVIGAIAAIIQAMKPESAKVEPLLALLEQVEKDVAAAERYAAAGDEEMVELVGVNALECLASIGKGLQVPDDIPIDIYEDDDTSPSNQPSFWESPEGQVVQQRIVGCFSVLRVAGNYSAAVDAACSVLRSGYTETEPGPFVLPPSVTVSFIHQCAVTTPQLDTVLATACMWITQHSRPTSTPTSTSSSSQQNVDVEVRAIYDSVVTFARTLGTSTTDPTVSMGCVDVFARLMPRYTHILLADESTSSTTLDFTLTAIMGPDVLPKRSACTFWTALMKPQTAALADDTRNRLAQVLSSYGSRVSECLATQIGGLAQRSELDFLCEPLKALLVQRGEAQTWLQMALASGSFPAPHVGLEERQRFLRQLLGVRSDGKKIKELVRAFWAACRGTVVSFGS